MILVVCLLDDARLLYTGQKLNFSGYLARKMLKFSPHLPIINLTMVTGSGSSGMSDNIQ